MNVDATPRATSSAAAARTGAPEGTGVASPPSSPTALAFDALPELRAQALGGLLLCDPPPDDGSSEPPVSKLVCGDGLSVGLRAIETGTDEPIERGWLQLPRCGSTCTEADHTTGKLTA
jgi:hypothetical protein